MVHQVLAKNKRKKLDKKFENSAMFIKCIIF